MTKSQIRTQIKVQKARLDDEGLWKASQTITEEVIKDKLFCASNTLFLYAAFIHEVQTKLIDQWARSQGKKVAYPKIEIESGEMTFYSVGTLEELENHCFKAMQINEPNPLIHLKVTPSEGDVMIVPGVAFDFHGNRIGYGGGFYDRYLKKYSFLYKIAVCLDFQLFNAVPTEAFDVKVNSIITEKRKICYFNRDEIQ